MLLTAILVLLTAGHSYKEDISDFLPLENEQQEAFMEYQNTSSARRIYVIFQSADNDCQPAVDLFTERAELRTTKSQKPLAILQGDDPEVVQEAMNTIYARMPYLLTAEDYARIDSMTEASDFIARQLENDKQMLMLPSGGMAAMQIQHDPLNLFASVLARQKPTNQAHGSMLLIDSPFGASETEHNAALVAMLQQVCDSVGNAYPDVSIHLTGGPVIAVGNAQQIKKDSIISITFAVILILFLLWLVFRNVRNLMLIAVSIAWGWLFAMGCLTLVHNDVSIIVIGISSVILGIAVNYPLHLIAHLSHTTDVRTALKEIRMPLVVGNVTTVGAFLALVPLQSVALRDLGLFSAFLLVGTIIFVLVWLPHMVQKKSDLSHHCVPHSDLQVREPSAIRHQPSAIRLLERLGDVQLENKRWIVGMVVILTVVLGYFSFQTSFDADLRNINYMTDEQRQDMHCIATLSPRELLEQPSMVNGQWSMVNGQWSMVAQWNEWRTTKGAALCQQLREKATAMGFADDSFDDFYKLMSLSHQTSDVQRSMFNVQRSSALTSAIVSSLTDNFNYIGWACGAIVFFFLWFSMGSIELALISFLPMAVSWLWILGIMALLGIQFNVVNIILATFIFGQGDDYTIFMTEGCQYEYAYRRKMLNSYKQSIIISALIMFIGIGSLIVARHPALRSLAEVTIVGMFTVVFMAWLLPAYCFRWLVYDRNGNERKQPITLCGLLFRNRNSAYQKVSDRYRYRGVEISMAVNRRLRYWRRHEAELSQLSDGETITDDGWGETALLVALLNPQRRYVAVVADDERAIVARHAFENVTNNLEYARKD
jgi:predicted exporter